MTGLRILRAGPACTVQDGGRQGWLRFGITPAGPMDWQAHAIANRIAGNPDGAAAVEIGPGGIAIRARGDLWLGVSACGFHVDRDGQPLPPRGGYALRDGQTLTIRPGDSHQWAYLAPAGAVDLPPVMGSLATHLRSGIGPLGALAAGALVPCRPAHGPDLSLPAASALPATLRLIPGPQDDAFTPDAMATLTGQPFTLGPRSDRMGYRLHGHRLAHAGGHDILSDGIAMGAMQVPGDGQPIVLMADRQPTGGYPKIATVIRADLPALAQARPGQALRFRLVTVGDAVLALRRALADIDIRDHLRPLSAGPDLALLASGNHASGFVRGDEPD